MSWLDFMAERSAGTTDGDIVRSIDGDIDIIDDEVGGECGYCGFGLDPEIICQSCLESMEEGGA